MLLQLVFHKQICNAGHTQWKETVHTARHLQLHTDNDAQTNRQKEVSANPSMCCGLFDRWHGFSKFCNHQDNLIGQTSPFHGIKMGSVPMKNAAHVTTPELQLMHLSFCLLPCLLYHTFEYSLGRHSRTHHFLYLAFKGVTKP